MPLFKIMMEIPKRTTIGKRREDDDAMMYPNPNFMKYFANAELPADEDMVSVAAVSGLCLQLSAFIGL